ncbi:Cinnamoyl-CoA reductase 2, partial [Glycine soja]
TLFKADFLNYESLCSAISGCTAVFHLACPVPSIIVPNPQAILFIYIFGVETIEPAVKGTTNVLEAKVQRLVFVSSIVAISINPNLPKDKVIDESYSSDKDYCKRTRNWYCFSKTEAEEQALDFAKRTGLDLVSICPSLVFWPILQSTTVNTSSLVLLKLLKGVDSLEKKIRWIVDVRYVVYAILLTYEKLEAKGRYVFHSHNIKTRDMLEKLKITCLTISFIHGSYTEVDDYISFSSEKLQRLGWKYRSLEEALIDSVESYREAGLLQSE